MVGTNNEAVRREWLKNTLESIPSGLRILDAGAGELANKKYCTHLDYTSQDFCQYEGDGNSKGLQEGSWNTNEIDIVGDITDIPEADQFFDVILCSEVLEHLPNPVKALEEFHRLLKQGGKLILTAPFCSLTHFAPYHYSSGYNKYFYEFHLENLGFKLYEVSSNGNFFEFVAQEVHRIPLMADKYSSKNISRLERYAINKVLKMLERFSNNNTTSDEVLCFGYHVVAVKS